MCEQYNGYSNYQTWCVALWLDNEQSTNEMLYDLANGINAWEWVGNEYDKAKVLQDWFLDFEPEDTLLGGVFQDLLTHAIGMVDWVEIIESHKED